MAQICTAIRESLRMPRVTPREALARVRRFGRGAEGGCTERFVSMFANEDSLAMPADVALGAAGAVLPARGTGNGPGACPPWTSSRETGTAPVARVA